MRRGLVLLLAVVVLTGCHEQWGSSTWGGGSSESSAESNVRASIPAIEAYYADNGTYEGLTLEGLRTTYDAALPDVVIVEASANTYCVESTVGTASYFKNGPGADIFPGHCGNAPPPLPPLTAHTDAEEAVLSAILPIEDYYARNGTYAGIDDAPDANAAPLSQVRIHVLNGGKAYCVEAPRGGPGAHFVGPQGPLAEGPC